MIHKHMYLISGTTLAQNYLNLAQQNHGKAI